MNGVSANYTASDSRRAYLLLIITTLCWGCNAILSKMAVGEISPMLLVSLRWFGVVLLLAVFSRRQIVNNWPELRKHLPYIAIMGSIGFTAFNALFYVAAHSTSAINIGILQGAIPVFTIVGSFIFFRIRITSIQAFGIGVTLLGVFTVASAGDLSQLLNLTFNQGDVLMLLAGFLYAAYSLGLMRRPAVPALALFAFLAGIAFLASLPLVIIESLHQPLEWPSTTGWLVVILVMLLPSFVAQICFIQGVTLIGPGRAGVFINLVPVFASIMAVIFLNESFEIFHGVSLALVLGGIGLSEIGKAK